MHYFGVLIYQACHLKRTVDQCYHNNDSLYQLYTYQIYDCMHFLTIIGQIWPHAVYMLHHNLRVI